MSQVFKGMPSIPSQQGKAMAAPAILKMSVHQKVRFFAFGERGMQFVEAVDEEITDETIKQARVVTEQDAEAVAKMLALLVCDECQVRGHCGRVCP